MWSCKHCKQLFEGLTTSQKANHTRWCESNPKAIEFRKSNAARIEQRFNKTHGSIKSFVVKCGSCSAEFSVEERENTFPNKDMYYCSRACANSVGGNAKADKYGRTQYITIAEQHYKKQCAVCEEKRVVDIHHIDEDRENNEPRNLIPLCPNHHALWHRNKDKEVEKVIMGHGFAWGEHFACTEDISRVRFPDAPPYFK